LTYPQGKRPIIGRKLARSTVRRITSLILVFLLFLRRVKCPNNTAPSGSVPSAPAPCLVSSQTVQPAPAPAPAPEPSKPQVTAKLKSSKIKSILKEECFAKKKNQAMK